MLRDARVTPLPTTPRPLQLPLLHRFLSADSIDYWPSRLAYSVLNWVFMGSSLSNSSMKLAKECRRSASEEVDLLDVVNRFETWSPNWKGYILSYWNAFVRSCLWISSSRGQTLDSWIMKMVKTTFFKTFRFECYYRNSCVVLLLSWDCVAVGSGRKRSSDVHHINRSIDVYCSQVHRL